MEALKKESSLEEQKLVEEKGEKSEDLWNTNQGAMKKEKQAFSVHL